MTQILIVDDDPTLRFVLTQKLQEEGYEVAAAPNGMEGVAQAQKLHPALVICDWMMPEMDGLAVCQQLKADPSLSTTFFILLTAHGETDKRIEGLEKGADGFLTKPINLPELNASVRAGLRLHQLTQDLQTKNQILEDITQDLQTQKQALEVQLTEGADYVCSLLPSPITEPMQVETRFIPSVQLGGDCFNYYQLDPDYWAIYLLDVSGHGIGAAMLSVSVLNLLRSQSLPRVNYYQPNDVLRALNETFQMTDHNDRYFTIWYGVYSQTKRRLIYSSAGHPPAVLISGKPNSTIKVKRLGVSGLPIGVFPEASFSNGFCDIEECSTLYIFSDGVYEIQRPDGELWSLNAFIDFLKMCRQTETSNLDRVLNHIQTLHEADRLDDDLSLLEINFG